MSNVDRRLLTLAVVSLAGLVLSGEMAYAQHDSEPNPYRTINNWAQLPPGRIWGSTSAIDIDPSGHIWVADRCSKNCAVNLEESPIFEFDQSGKLLKNFGAGMFLFPHGMYVDKDGNVWVTDAGRGKDGKGQQVFKFSPDGKVLLTLGKAGVSGEGPDTFNGPCDIVVGANGDIFVGDGHENSVSRIMKFSKDGKFIKQWGKKGSGPGELDTPHSLALDSNGRLFVADRGNSRIQIFDQDGKLLDIWKQFGRPSGLFIDPNDILYSADSESGNVTINPPRNPGWNRGIRIGSVRDAKVMFFIPDPDQNATTATWGVEGVVADPSGNIYGAEVGNKDVKKFVKK
jgi:streptogramin lyase